LNTEFPNIVNRTINGIGDLNTREKNLVQAIARNFADACIRRGVSSGSSIACNAQGIVEWTLALSPWKNRSDATISSMTQIGNVSYTDYDSKITPIVFGNSSWASGGTSTLPSSWGNYEHVLSDGTPVSDAIFPMLSTEFSRNPRNTSDIDFLSEDPMELAVYPDHSGLVDGKVFNAKAIQPDPNGFCEYSFTATVLNPQSLGTPGLC
jgi:hypothetical protein